MKHLLLSATIIALTTTSAMADETEIDYSWNTIGASYQVIAVDAGEGSIDFSGYVFSGSYELSNNFVIGIGYSSLDQDDMYYDGEEFNISSMSVTVGKYIKIQEDIDLFGAIRLAKIEAEYSDRWDSYSDNTTSKGVEVGIAARGSEFIQSSISIGMSFGEDDSNGFLSAGIDLFKQSVLSRHRCYIIRRASRAVSKCKVSFLNCNLV